MPLIDFSKKDASGNPAIITGKEPVVEAVPTPADWEPPVELNETDYVPQEDDLETVVEVDTVPTPTFDCSTVPDGRWGRDKIVAWFEDNGIPVPDEAKKSLLVAQAKEICKTQETT